MGLATARELLLRGVKRVAVLETEHAVAQHQSGRNSGVVHAGIYYKAGSLKAQLCVEGLERSYKYFEQKKIPYKKVGKLIVALDVEEKRRLERIFSNALNNNVPGVKMLQSNEEIRKVEPECAGIAAIHSPHTGIVDWGFVARQYAADVEELGGAVLTGHRVVALYDSSPVHISVHVFGRGLSSICSEKVVCCAGVYADRVAQLSGGRLDPQIVPIRGEYLTVKKGSGVKLHGNIYPVPHPEVPFLGVHFTPTMNGSMIVGPNAVLAFARDGYDYSKIRREDLMQTLSSKSFWKLARRHLRFGVGEMYRSVFLRSAAKRARRYVPRLALTDFEWASSKISGVRAQALDKNGQLVDDFVFEDTGNIVHVRNAPSPAATSSLAIARKISDRILM